MIVLLGKTASGKTSIRNELIKLGYKSIVTYTTRPMRPGEVDGIDYHFITDDEFNNIDFFEKTEYRVANGCVWKYGTAKEDLDNDAVLIVNPDGFDKYRRYANVTSFYIKCDTNIIQDRLLRRGDDNAESVRRLKADEKDFWNIEKCVDFVITNNGKHSVEKLAKIIKELN